MRVLVVKLTSLGDVIHTLPAITDAATQITNFDVHWLVEENFQVIPNWHPAVSEVFTAATRRWRKQPSKLLTETSTLKQQLTVHDYDLIIDAQGLLKSSILARYAKGKKVGYDKNSIKEPLACRFYHKSFAVDKHEHAVTRTRKLFAQALNYDVPDSLDYGIPVEKFSQKEREQYLVFLHGTTWTTKQWPTQNWKELVTIAASNGFQVKLLWGNESEYNRASEIAGNHENASVCAKLDLNEITALLSNSSGVVAVDTGLGHLAAALSVPCISLYGATDSRRTGTIGDSQKHLQAQFECSPCLLKTCTYKGKSELIPACFNQFQAKVVWHELEQLINSE